MNSIEPDCYHHPEPQLIGYRSSGAGVIPAGWLVDNIRAWFNLAIDTLSRGTPEPMGPRDKRPIGQSYHQPEPWGDTHLLLTRRFDRGAYAYGYRFGALSYDPIGPGVVTTRPMEPTKPAANALPFGIGVTWAPQGINYGVTPRPGGPLYDPQTLAAMMGNNTLAGMLSAGEYFAPYQGGFSS